MMSAYFLCWFLPIFSIRPVPKLSFHTWLHAARKVIMAIGLVSSSKQGLVPSDAVHGCFTGTVSYPYIYQSLHWGPQVTFIVMIRTHGEKPMVLATWLLLANVSVIVMFVTGHSEVRSGPWTRDKQSGTIFSVLSFAHVYNVKFRSLLVIFVIWHRHYCEFVSVFSCATNGFLLHVMSSKSVLSIFVMSPFSVPCLFSSVFLST